MPDDSRETAGYIDKLLKRWPGWAAVWLGGDPLPLPAASAAAAQLNVMKMMRAMMILTASFSKQSLKTSHHMFS